MGKLNRSVWHDDEQHEGLLDLRGSGRFYDTADGVDRKASFRDVSDLGKNYVQIFRGYFIAPETAEFRFWLSGNAQASLLLSSSEDKFDKKERINLFRQTRPNAWGDEQDQASLPIRLHRNKRYYFELQHRVWKEKAHLNLAWSYASGLGLENWASDAKAVATQSSTEGPDPLIYHPAKAIDGNCEGSLSGHSVTRTTNEVDPWWQVNLGHLRLIDRVEIYNQKGRDHKLDKALTHFRISILNEKGEVEASVVKHQSGTHVRATEFWETGGVVGTTVKIECLGGVSRILGVAEVKVLGRKSKTESYQAMMPVPLEVFESYEGSLRDQDADELPDDWERNHQLNPALNEPGVQLADWDRDGLNTVSEALRGTDPKKPDSVPGLLTVEKWIKVPGYGASSLRKSERFNHAPRRRMALPLTSYVELHVGNAVRLRGYIEAPESGDYTFSLSSRNGAEFWLSSDSSKYRKERLLSLGREDGDGNRRPRLVSSLPDLWGHFPSQESKPVALVKGRRYFFETFAQCAGDWGPHVSLAWTRPDHQREPLPLGVIYSYAIEDKDADDNGLPDTWEISSGLGMTEKVVRAREYHDADQDGLTNRQEYLLGTYPTRKDTDGDGLADRDEHRAYRTDPTKKDRPHEEVVHQMNLAAHDGHGFLWERKETGLIPTTFRGPLSLKFEVPRDDYYILNIDTKLIGKPKALEDLELDLAIGQMSLGRQTLVFGEDHRALLRVITPYLKGGGHRITLNIDNKFARRSLSILSGNVLRPVESGSPSPTLISQLALENTLAPYSRTSQVSPAFIEGKARFLPILNQHQVHPGTDDRHWYGNLPLLPEGQTEFHLHYESGISKKGHIYWEVTDVFADEELTVRKGDSLKLGANSPEGVFLIVPSEKNWARHPDASAKQSSVRKGFRADRAIDGNTDWDRAALSFSHTKTADHQAWWQVDLGHDRWINRVVLWNMAHGQHHLANYSISVLNKKGDVVISKEFHRSKTHSGNNEVWFLGELVQGRSVKIQRLGPDSGGEHKLALVEVQVFGAEEVTLSSEKPFHRQKFSEPGRHTVIAQRPDESTGHLTVHVKSILFGNESKNALNNFIGRLYFPKKSLDPTLFYDGGENVFVAIKKTDREKFDSLGISAQATGSRRILARLYQGGPVLAAQALNLMDCSDAFQNQLGPGRVSQHYPGYLLYTAPLVVTHLPPDVRLEIQTANKDAVFPDGSIHKFLSRDDFHHGFTYVDILYPKGKFDANSYHLYPYDRGGVRLGRR